MSKLSKDPMLAAFQEKLYILATVAAPLLTQNIELLSETDLDFLQEIIIDFGHLAIKVDEVTALEETLDKS